MRAVQIDRFGTPDVLTIVEAPRPEPGPGDVLIRTVATSLNPVDDKTRAGAIAGLTLTGPMTLGWDLAGIVVDGGDSAFDPGDRVIAMSHQLSTGRGTWADLVSLPSSSVAPAPDTVSLPEAATLPLPGLTAWQTLDWLRLAPGQRLLITGAAGAVGGLALQIAAARGITVDALVSRSAQTAFAHDHGAAFATTDPTALTPRTYDAVLDTYGAFLTPAVTEAVTDGGRLASIATEAGPVPDLSPRAIRTTTHQVHEDGPSLTALTHLVNAGALHPRLHTTYPLHHLHPAHTHLHTGSLPGKIAITF
ncbi:NADP-dependent oxidoreductase [Kitasatospora sp. NPDC101183]|uniref:NADP-dependent oxidoreductase n=1 Tax=Kitasatospora sp. NPDC101183 TaxID=3364100 RepID=UPI00380EACED